MTFSFYAATVPVFSRALTNLSAILAKAEAWAGERKIDPTVLIQARLAPDMHALPFQIQSSTDRAKFTLMRLTGREGPSWPDDEKSFGELQARLKKAQDYLAAFGPGDLEGAEDRDVTVKIGGKDVVLKGSVYLLERQLPHFWFHVTTAYDILRHNGVPLTKGDFVG